MNDAWCFARVSGLLNLIMMKSCRTLIVIYCSPANPMLRCERYQTGTPVWGVSRYYYMGTWTL